MQNTSHYVIIILILVKPLEPFETVEIIGITLLEIPCHSIPFIVIANIQLFFLPWEVFIRHVW